jgi:protein-export membrane protein SecD/preprotein translocase SecF subunit
MSDKNLYARVGLIVLVVTLAVWQIWPPEERLKGGIDLAGGTSLLYEIDTSGLEEWQKRDLAERVMQRLKQRVDPKGQRNLVWRPIGTNRLEIQMPRPPEQLAQRRQAYEAVRDKIRATNINRLDIESMLNLTGNAREQAIQGLIRGVPRREAMLRELAATEDKLDAAGATTQPVGVDADALRTAFYDGIDALLATNIPLERLGDTLDLGKDSPARVKAMKEMKEQYPARTKLIDELVAAHDLWAEKKGPLEDASDLMRLLRGQGVLEFRILAEPDGEAPDVIYSNNALYRDPIEKYTGQLEEFGPRRRPGDNYLWFRVKDPTDFEPAGRPIIREYMDQKYVLAHDNPEDVMLHDGTWQLQSARPTRDQMNRWIVEFSLDPRGGAKFGKLTEANIGHPLCILLDDEAMSAPNIKDAIYSRGTISGDFTQDEVVRLCNILEAGSLDARLKDPPLSIKTVGPSLGEHNRQLGFQACMTALVLVVAFMAVYYLYGGLIADVAVMLNLLIVLGIMAMIQGTFTLPGIAGLILTLGMAVDANVLIFERIREEQARGVSLRMAVKLGYDRAFWPIFDANLTSVIAAIILGYIGSEEIKGFALTLGIGLCVSLFTALFVTRQFFTVMVQNRVSKLEVKRCWGGAAILAGAAGLFAAVGYAIHGKNAWTESSLGGLGVFLGVGAGSAVGLLGLMWLMRYLAIATGAQRTNRIPMLHLLKPPNIDWMSKYKFFWPISAVITLGGLLLFALQPNTTLFDIEFLGGTSVQVSLLPKDRSKPIVDAQVEDIVKGVDDPSQAGGWLNWAAQKLEAAASGGGIEQIDDHTDRLRIDELSETQLEALLIDTLKGRAPKNWITPSTDGVTLTFRDPTTLDSVRKSVLDAARQARAAAEALHTSARVQSVEDVEAAGPGEAKTQAFEIVSTVTNKQLMAEAILGALARHPDRFTVQVQRPIGYTLVTDDVVAPDGAFPIMPEARELGDVIGEPAPYNIQRHKGGVAMVFDELKPPQTLAAIDARLHEMRLQPEFEQYDWRESQVYGLTQAGMAEGPGGKKVPTYSKIAVVVSDENLAVFENEDAWRRDLATPELALAQAALSNERSLDKVTQFAPQVAGQAAQEAFIALLLAMIAMVSYLWFRFGSMEYGLGAILALIHDVAVTLGLVTSTHWIAGTFIGDMLGITNMRIDLALVAAFLTVVGYSVNDTIVVFDRIRENRGRLATVSPQLINAAINQTLPRSILTSFTTLLVVVVLYVVGGPGVHAFAFAMIVGVVSGTYSSIAIASPILYRPGAMRAMLAIVVAALAGGLMIGGGSHTERVIMGVIAAAALALLLLWHLKRREAEARVARPA